MDNSSCLLLASSLHTAVDLRSIISAEDLRGDGLINDSHITIVYDPNSTMNKDAVLDDVKLALGDEFYVFMEFMKDSYKFRVNDLMNLSTFNNDDSSYLVLKLNEDNNMFNSLSLINRYLVNKYKISEGFPKYTPHLTLAELNPGQADKYLDNKILLKVLNDSKVGFEDLVFSKPGVNEKYDHWNVTTFHALDRFFRESNKTLDDM